MKVIRRYYQHLLLAVAVPVLATVLFGWVVGVVSFVALVVGVTLGMSYLAEEVTREVARVREETDEQPFPFM